MAIVTGQDILAADVVGGASLPSGLIVMWHGLISSIPSGFVICDGNNSTPDLLEKFVQGVATAGTNPGAIGGSKSQSHSSHKHTMPTHVHNVDSELVESGTNRGTGKEGDTDPTDPGDTNFTTQSSHSDIRPPFYDIAFIMKT